MGFGVPYRFLAGACAGVIVGLPWLEPPFVRFSRLIWSAPIIGRFFRSVAYRYAGKLTSTDDQFRSVSVQGFPLTANVTNFSFTGIYFGGVPYEEALTRYLVEHLRPDSVFVDVGANAGYFSLLASALTGPSGRGFAFEPNPPVYRLLAEHVARNALGDRVRTFEVALGERRSEAVSLFVSPAHSGLSTILTSPDIPSEFSRYRPVQVSTITFDEWRKQDSVDRVDLMKIDVEGFEAHVLKGMAGSLRERRIVRVVCETAWDSPAHRMLVEFGFRPTFLESVGAIANIAYNL